MEMGMNNIRLVAQNIPDCHDPQQYIQIDFMPGGTDNHPVIKRHAPTSPDGDTIDIPAIRISQDRDPVA